MESTNEPQGKGPERSSGRKELTDISEDPHAGIVGMLIGDVNRLTDRSAVLSELNQLSSTKDLSGEEKEKLADRIMIGRQPKDQSSPS